MNNKFIAGLVMLLLSYNTAKADTPYLERTLTISLHEERLDEALKKISKQGNFTFSYNPSILAVEKIVSYDFVNKTVREILDQLFNGTVQYKARGKYIILLKSQASSQIQEPQLYTGYVIDEATGERLKNVSIYDPKTLQSAKTDSYGYFEIKIEKPAEDLTLAINKQNYTDTLVVVPSRTGRLLNIPLHIDKEKINTLADSVGKKLKRFWERTKVFTLQQVNMANIKDTLHRKAQVSFVPFIGTNRALSGNVINDYSFNILGGYSYGVRKMEVGGIFNIVRGDVNGFQLAGNFNAVGGNVKGVQVAGIFNANRGKTDGAQLAGVFNFNWDQVRDFSAAGVFNFSRHGSHAVQLAGIANITIEDQESPHVAGLFNFTTRDSKSQLAGSHNFTGHNVTGWQAAGVLNFAGKNVKGAQTASVLNFAGKEINGVQIAGILNYATKVNGAQIGLLNIADSVKGIPIGLVSIVMKGYHKFEIAADEIFYTNIAFRTGIRQFYNILTAGAKPSSFNNNTTFWTFGYGLGTAPKLSRKLFLNVDVTSNQIVQDNSFDAINLLHKLYLGVDFQMARKFSLSAGATLNAYVTNNSYDKYRNLFTDYQPQIFYNKDFGKDLNIRMWIGGKVGLRFL